MRIYLQSVFYAYCACCTDKLLDYLYFKQVTMESRWTSKYAILRDLSVAQGREVPVEIKDTVSKDEKPPALNYTEETEKEFFENCVSNGDFAAGPDITLIQQMLELVREFNVTDFNEVEDDTNVLEISKINHEGSLDITHPSQVRSNPVKNERKPKRKRNVAVASLIESYGDNLQSHNIEATPILLKPDDIISDHTNTHQLLPSNKQKESNIQMVVSPTSMFKKKSSQKSLDQKQSPTSSKSMSPLECTNTNQLLPSNMQKERNIQAVVSPTFMFKKKSSQKSLDQKQSPTSSKSMSPLAHTKPVSFVPSLQAAEYYKKYVERNEVLQEGLQDDIWTRTQKKMKEIEKKRKQDNLLSSSGIQETNEGELHGLDYIKLSEHRHTLDKECIVCLVLCEDKK